MLFKQIFILGIVTQTFVGLSQDTIIVLNQSLFKDPHHPDLTKDWKYFTLSDTLSLKIIDHYPAIPCGVFQSASVTIGQTELRDTIRVLDYCNSNRNYFPGQFVKVLPAKTPTHYVPIAVMFVNNDTKPLYFKIKKTTWGSLVN